MSAGRPDTWPRYPLCLSRGEVDANDLQRYHEDLETRAADLFAADETICHVELREHAPDGAQLPIEAAGRPVLGSGTTRRGSGQGRDASPGREGRLSAPVSVSTAESLRSALDVREPAAHVPDRLVWLTLEPGRAVARHHEDLVSKPTRSPAFGLEPPRPDL